MRPLVFLCVQGKYNGVRFHELNEKDKRMAEEVGVEGLEDFPNRLYSGFSLPVYEELKDSSTFIADDQEDDCQYFYIDRENIDAVLNGIKNKITQLLDRLDYFDFDNYIENEDLFTFINLYGEINGFRKKTNFENAYLIMEASHLEE